MGGPNDLSHEGSVANAVGILEDPALRAAILSIGDEPARIRGIAAQLEKALGEQIVHPEDGREPCLYQMPHIPPKDLSRRSQRVPTTHWYPGFGRR